MWRVSEGQRQHITGVWPCETSCRQGQRGAHDTSAPPARRQVRACCCSLREATQRTHAHKPIPTSLRRPRRHGPSVRPIPATTSHPSFGSQRAGRHSAAVRRLMQRVPPAPHTLFFTPPRLHAAPYHTHGGALCHHNTSCVATPCVVTRLGEAPIRPSPMRCNLRPLAAPAPHSPAPTQGTQPTAAPRRVRSPPPARGPVAGKHRGRPHMGELSGCMTSQGQ